MSTIDRLRAENLALAAALDALVYFASPDACASATRALDAREFTAWDQNVSDTASAEIRALADCYHGTPAAPPLDN